MSTLESRTSARRKEAEPVTVIGAGPAGLACAIALARAGRRVVVREWHRNVRARFHGDFQGLENWSSEQDVFGELRAGGIDITFACHPVSEVTAFDDRGAHYRIQGSRPIHYLVRRGPGEDTIDEALLRQASAAGAEIRFDDRVDTIGGIAVLATGPRRPDAIAVGYLFDTNVSDGAASCCRSCGTGTVNRFVFNLVGEGGRRYALKELGEGDAGLTRRRLYQTFNTQSASLSSGALPLSRATARPQLRPRQLPLRLVPMPGRAQGYGADLTGGDTLR